MRALCESAVEAAQAAGAEYADARAVVRRSQSVSTKNGRIENVNDVETEGIGVRVLAGGAWGFACDRRLDADGAVSAARRATAFALASSVGRSRALAPVEARSGSYRTPIEIDPFDVPLADKVDLCLRAEAALRHDTVVVTQASVRAQREHKVLFSSDGVEAEQELYETGGGLEATAVDDGRGAEPLLPERHGGSAPGHRGLGVHRAVSTWRAAPRVAEEASALLRAKTMPPGTTTVILDGSQVALQIHESCGHPIELDRVLGTEAAFAGTSFLTPDKLGSFTYGSDAWST